MAVVNKPYLQERAGWGVGDPSGLRRRAYIGAALFSLAFCGLLGRLWYLQVLEGTEMLAQAQHNRVRHVPLRAPRGLVLDRHGAVLATSRPVHSVALVPAALPSARTAPADRDAILGTLAFLLHITVDDIEATLQEAHERNAQIYDPVNIAEGVDLKTITLIEENKYRLGPAVLVTNDLARSYPNGALASHVLGYTGMVTEDDIANSQDPAHATAGQPLRYDDFIGKGGIERQYDGLLRGTPGSEDYEVDARQNPLRLRGMVKETPGQTITLSIDAKMQAAAEQALSEAANNGAVAAIDPRNGEVLALASRPGYDPNIFSLPREQFKPLYQALVKDPSNPLINRAVTSRFPPGSTFKIVTASAALQQGTTTTSTITNCTGGMRLGRFFGCWQIHGDLDIMGAIAKSCDVFFYQAALRMGDPESSGPSYLAGIARQFGLGARTGIDLPVDGAGLIPDPAWRRTVNAGNPDLMRWYPGNTLNMSIGQGDVLCTPLQMALATAAVANGGTLWQPRLLHSVQTSKGPQYKASQGRSVGIAPANLAIVRAAMRQCVTDGTGRMVTLPNVEIAGKTGSAEDSHHDLPHAWFVCFAPYDHPTIAIAVMVENAGHGAENAAPIAKKMLQVMFPAGTNGN